MFTYQIMNFVLCIALPFHFMSHMSLIFRWYADHPADGNQQPRAISVGLAPDTPVIYDRRTGLAEGHTVPEADREVFQKPLHFSMKIAVEGIPVQNDNCVENEIMIRMGG